MKRKYIRGIPFKGEDIINMFEELGAQNYWNLYCEDPIYLYFINEDNIIDCAPTGTYDYNMLLKHGEELVLPSVKVIEPDRYYWFAAPKSKNRFEILLNELQKYTEFTDVQKQLIFNKYLSTLIIYARKGGGINTIEELEFNEPMSKSIINDLKLYGVELTF